MTTQIRELVLAYVSSNNKNLILVGKIMNLDGNQAIKKQNSLKQKNHYGVGTDVIRF